MDPQKREKTIGQRMQDRVRNVQEMVPAAVEGRRRFLEENRLESPLNRYGAVTYLVGLKPSIVANLAIHILYSTLKNPYLRVIEKLEVLEADPPEQYVMEAYRVLAERYTYALASAEEMRAAGRGRRGRQGQHRNLARREEVVLRNGLIDQALRVKRKDQQRDAKRVFREQRQELAGKLWPPKAGPITADESSFKQTERESQ